MQIEPPGPASNPHLHSLFRQSQVCTTGHVQVTRLIPISQSLLGLILLAFLCTPTVSMASGHTDTLSYFNTRDASIFYRDPGIRAQAARFDLAAPAYVRQVTIWLTGKGTGNVSVTLYGNEAAFAAPLVGSPLTGSYLVEKTRVGVQKIVLDIADDVFIDRPQFFVVLSEMSPEIHWLSDRQEREPRCVDGADRWFYQAIQNASGEWQSGKYAYAIETIVDVPETYSPGYLADVTADLEFPDDILEEPMANQNIAWSDVNTDGQFDLLVGGRLFVNRGERGFEEMTEKSGLPTSGISKAHVFLDADNDRDVDILWISEDDEGVTTTRLLRNNGDGEFTSTKLDLGLSGEITTYSVADVDGDHDLDLFITGRVDEYATAVRSYIFRNNGAGAFTTQTLRELLPESQQEIASYSISSAQWIDVDQDDDLDLSLSFSSSTIVGQPHAVLINDGSGRFAIPSESTTATVVIDHSETDITGVSGASSDWGVVEAGASPELLQPVSLGVDAVRDGRADRSATLRGKVDNAFDEIPYQSYPGAGIWGDADNNGRLDALLTSSCDCRFATLYLSERRGVLSDRSFDYGLFRIPAGTDAVWIDFNNDGLLDLATFVQGRFRLFENTLHSENSFVEVDLSGALDGDAVGGSVTVYTGETSWTRTLMSGRGALMQGPPVLHFGLGSNNVVDSIVYTSLSGDDRRVIEDPRVNTIYQLFYENSLNDRADISATMAVSPNPFTAVLRFEYTMAQRSDVRIQIHAIDGSVVGVPIDEIRNSGTHTAEWKPIDPTGSPLPAGTYIWRATIGRQTLTGRAVLAK